MYHLPLELSLNIDHVVAGVDEEVTEDKFLHSVNPKYRMPKKTFIIDGKSCIPIRYCRVGLTNPRFGHHGK